jgi:hypothetical protein
MRHFLDSKHVPNKGKLVWLLLRDERSFEGLIMLFAEQLLFRSFQQSFVLSSAFWILQDNCLKCRNLELKSFDI